ncbi:MAG: hypothetical protein JO299_13930 [Gammaproteobacteria bacterium]|jgi:hypothetical protein|nr:hypothetical protein [Gammaproteobacteria bacterium]
MRRAIRVAGVLALMISMLTVDGCGPGSVGVGMSVGVPVGTRGYMSVGTSRWR